MHIYASGGASLKMQVKKTTTTIAVVAVAALLLLTTITITTTTPPTAVFAQDSEGAEEVAGTIFVEEEEEEEDTEEEQEEQEEEEENITEPLGYQEVERAEVIDNTGTVQNPGGAGNENISLSEIEMMTRPTNLAETVLPQTIQAQEYQDIKLTLQAAGYSISDMQYTLEYGTGASIIIVRGLEGVPTQPNLMDLESIGAAYGYALRTHVFIGGAWETTYASVTGN